ncbi:MAG: exosortase/archaeosortase family protein [Phycisphaerae bacterium]|nr:exosortase/archaeosortase family protein [Phycisphaerae bacterium]
MEHNERPAAQPRRLADMMAPVEAVREYPIESSSWGKVAVLSGVLTLLYWTEIQSLVRLWLADENWSHGFIIPLFSLFLVYNWRHQILITPRRACYWGWLFMVLAIFIRSVALVFLHNTWIAQLTIPLMIFGVVMYLCGPRIARILFVPIFFLALAMPLPDAIYQSISLRLQNLAAAMSTALMRMFGAEIQVTASFMEVTSVTGQVHPLQVAEACSGVRSLMAFVALGVAMAYVQERPFWQRLVIMLMGIPIALVVNILRVAATSTMYVYDRPELGQDFMHTAMGMVLLIPALLFLFLLTQLLDSLYMDAEEEDEDEEQDESETVIAAAEAPEVKS